jgi:CRISPR-associated exonuclease Cas4
MQLILAALLAALAVALFIFAWRQRKKSGIPTGKVIYIDASRWGKVEKPLYDPGLHLAGRPDYLVQQGDKVIPVEVKSRRAPATPHDSHIFQLGAYCLLVKHQFGNRPSHGILHYRDKTFSIDFTREFEQAVRLTIRQMQEKDQKEPLERSHQEPSRCTGCGYKSICDQSLRI